MSAGAGGILKVLAAALSREPAVLFAYAYGSILTRRDPRDVDVAVSLRQGRDPWEEAQRIADVLERASGYALVVDVHALNGAPPAFAFEVLSKGRVLFARRKAARIDWEAHALSRYQDIKPLLDFHDRRLLAR